ncbi:DUF342 domain-containing protein [Pseudoalteromonas tunicata]|uniref:Putative orphan protein n=1 Tax=Pseudoalteromonas tunicata D2 TaxID=87626 RepID=A4CCZ2_9GAMM|nr:FapA family protein [Pseudoalteromonas tunicata]ATC93941.1 hypothetical protein PTUN_a1294 [Pseudoalteromonas tunicata]AXT29730.1 DUF342 domain-containing protein [Pseudoalteromonas tunicata]EAR27435.1 putative orphan protein [Pseudoalteromonas tunicata D2]MDP4983107.1 FapA family protein [Pseudoalteromonas tunicata]
MSLFEFNEQSKTVELLQHPIESGFPASAAQLLEAIEASPYCEFQIDLALIRTLFTDSKLTLKPPFIIAKAIDATVSVRVDETNMSAQATFIAAQGGQIATFETVKEAIINAGVQKGVSGRAIEDFLGRQFEASAGESYSAIIAHGRRAKDGDDTRFVRLCATAQDRILSPQVQADGKVDMRDLGAIITVNPGAPLMQRIPPTKGEDGFTVFGDELIAKPGRDFSLMVMDGTAIDPNNPNVLVAAAVGVPVALSRGMRVDDVICYDNIDVTTGHVEFDGSVIVSGDIKDGMKVKATGDITVMGFVESAIVQSDSVITIVNGAIGRKREEDDDFTCVIKGKGSISLGYAQYSQVFSEQDLMIDKQVLHCELSAGRLIRVGKGDKPRGKIIGGKILNALRVETGELGAPSGTRTQVFIGQYWHELREKQSQLSELEKALNAKSAALRQARKKAEKIPSKQQKQLYLSKIAASDEQLLLKLKHVYRNKEILKNKLNGLLKNSRVTINELMHPGVELQIARDNKTFSRIYPPHLLRMSEGKITQTF